MSAEYCEVATIINEIIKAINEPPIKFLKKPSYFLLLISLFAFDNNSSTILFECSNNITKINFILTYKKK